MYSQKLYIVTSIIWYFYDEKEIKWYSCSFHLKCFVTDLKFSIWNFFDQLVLVKIIGLHHSGMADDEPVCLCRWDGSDGLYHPVWSSALCVAFSEMVLGSVQSSGIGLWPWILTPSILTVYLWPSNVPSLGLNCKMNRKCSYLLGWL